jgi:hypothetical protein
MASAFQLLGRVFEALALALALMEGLLVGSSLGGRAETRMTGIGMSPPKPGMREINLSKAYIQTNKV